MNGAGHIATANGRNRGNPIGGENPLSQQNTTVFTETIVCYVGDNWVRKLISEMHWELLNRKVFSLVVAL